MVEEFEDSFTGILLNDAFRAMKQWENGDNQSSRRNLVRTSFSAIEGFVWIFREHIVGTAQSTYGLEENEDRALLENSYQVSEQGRISIQPKFISLISQIRLIARIAERLAPQASIDFSGEEWSKLREAVKIRNRITHPKSAADLKLSKDDVNTCLIALFWFLEQSENAMQHANYVAQDYLGQFKDVFEKLQSGDPEITELYKKVSEIQNQD